MMRKGFRAVGRPCPFMAVCLFLILSVLSSCLLTTAASAAKSCVIEADFLSLDLTGAGDGYVLVKAAPCTANLKLLISLGDRSATVSQNSSGEWQRHNLYFGRGNYSFCLCENVSGNKYRKLAELHADITSDCRNNWLESNDHVVFDNASRITALADSICSDADSQQTIFRRICSYIERNYAFDYIVGYKTAKLDYEVLPDIDRLLDTRMGICKDLSAAAVAMLRSQGVPAVMAYGFGDGKPHAWVVAEVDGSTKLFDPTAAVTGARVENYRLLRLY